MKILVTRHPALVEYFSNMGITFDKVITHATAEDVTGNDVYGVLPLHLASLANTVTTVDMDLPAEIIEQQIATALDLIVMSQRFPDGKRYVTSISEISLSSSGSIKVQEVVLTYRKEVGFL